MRGLVNNIYEIAGIFRSAGRDELKVPTAQNRATEGSSSSFNLSWNSIFWIKLQRKHWLLTEFKFGLRVDL